MHFYLHVNAFDDSLKINWPPFNEKEHDITKIGKLPVNRGNFAALNTKIFKKSLAQRRSER